LRHLKGSGTTFFRWLQCPTETQPAIFHDIFPAEVGGTRPLITLTRHDLMPLLYRKGRTDVMWLWKMSKKALLPRSCTQNFDVKVESSVSHGLGITYSLINHIIRTQIYKILKLHWRSTVYKKSQSLNVSESCSTSTYPSPTKPCSPASLVSNLRRSQ